MKKNGTLKVEFAVELEVHQRAQFQKEGHMLFQLYGPGDKPEDLPIRRPWQGNQVFVVATSSVVGDVKQKLRVMSDSGEDAMRLMHEQIVNTLWGRVRENEVLAFNNEQFLSLNKQFTKLQQYLQKHYASTWTDWLARKDQDE
jgi:hypothetical protein